MSTKPVFPCALLLALAGVSAAPAGDFAAPPPGPLDSAPAPLLTSAQNEVPPPNAINPPLPPSRWVTYTCPECCGPIGGDGPIRMGIFLRTGPVLPVHGGFLSGTTSTGWTIEGGGDSYFFNTTRDAAWIVELSVSHDYNNGNRPFLTYFLEGDHVSTDTLNRTFINIGFGREWWLLGSACSCERTWRAGVDAGYRYGTARLDVHQFDNASGEFERLNGMVAGPYAALHTDVEFPCGCCCVFFAGVRAEWDYTFMNLVPLQNNDLMDVNLLLNIGVRY
jgi:hypothetical protein